MTAEQKVECWAGMLVPRTADKTVAMLVDWKDNTSVATTVDLWVATTAEMSVGPRVVRRVAELVPGLVVRMAEKMAAKMVVKTVEQTVGLTAGSSFWMMAEMKARMTAVMMVAL